jgi:molybdopterin-guanine dinucleotide biosynthesis protein A
LEISAAILAGGRATRLGGADKASLVIAGRRIVDRQLAAIAAAGGGVTDVTIVVGAAADAARYADLGIAVVADAVAGAGPLGGVYTALAGARHDRVLVLACDLPFVSAALVERLAVESRAGEEVDAVVPRSARGLEPLCAVYRTRCAAAARACVERGELRMTAFLAELHVRELDAGDAARGDEETLFENVNTPHDYARARGLVELDEKPSEDRITE